MQFEVSLIGTWVHSPEESSQLVEIYRRPASPPVRSRGKRKLTFNENGSLTVTRPNEVDRTESLSGTWKVDNHVIQLCFEGTRESFEILECGRDQLKLARVS